MTAELGRRRGLGLEPAQRDTLSLLSRAASSRSPVCKLGAGEYSYHSLCSGQGLMEGRRRVEEDLRLGKKAAFRDARGSTDGTDEFGKDPLGRLSPRDRTQQPRGKPLTGCSVRAILKVARKWAGWGALDRQLT